MAAVLVALVVLLVAAAAVQLALPRLAERRIRRRLLAGGGTARVRVRALPATRLLHNAGDRIEVRGSGLEIKLAPGAAAVSGEASPTRGPGLAALDGFAAVDIELVDFSTGPFAIDGFVLERAGGGSYAMAVRAQTTPAELAALGLEALLIPGGTVLSSVAGATSLGSRSFSVALEIELFSEPDGLRVGAGGGAIGGYPAGPLAATIAATIARRLEIVP